MFTFHFIVDAPGNIGCVAVAACRLLLHGLNCGMRCEIRWEWPIDSKTAAECRESKERRVFGGLLNRHAEREAICSITEHRQCLVQFRRQRAIRFPDKLREEKRNT